MDLAANFLFLKQAAFFLLYKNRIVGVEYMVWSRDDKICEGACAKESCPVIQLGVAIRFVRFSYTGMPSGSSLTRDLPWLSRM